MDGYIYNYTTAGNPVVDITGTSLQLLINFRDKNANAPSDHAPGSVGVLAFGALQVAARTPLSETFDQLWGVNKDSTGRTMQQRAVAQVIQEVQSQGGSNVSGSFPSTGALRSLVLAKGPVFLSYWLASASFKFSKGPLGADWNLTFDTELFVTIDTQNWPTISPKASVTVTNANISAANVGATVDESVQAVGNFLSSQPLAIFQGQEGDVDSSAAPPPDLSALTTFFTTLSSTAIPLGFLTLNPFIDSGAKTLNLRLVHAVDPAPVVLNDATAHGPSLFNPMLQINQTEVTPGQQVQVIGSYFPSNAATGLRIDWNDTSSGTLAESDIDSGPANGQTNVATESRHPNDNNNFFIATGLKPNTAYKFRVRDCDQLTCSDWSNWLTITTQGTNQVNLLLTAGGKTQTIGTATLASSGAFSVTVTIPANAALGVNHLSAELGGAELTSVNITVVATSQAAKPTLAVIDPNTNAVLQTPIVESTRKVSLQGRNFAPGSVPLYVDSKSGPQLGTATAAANGTFNANFVWPTVQTGSHLIVAYTTVNGQPAQATAGVYSEALPT